MTTPDTSPNESLDPEDLEIVRDRALQEGFQPPPELQDAFEKIYKYGNVLGQSPKKRLEWAKSLDFPVLNLAMDPRPVDVLWAVECFPSYYPRNQIVSRSFAKILNLLGVDTTYQQTILGLLIFAAVAADQVFRRKSA